MLPLVQLKTLAAANHLHHDLDELTCTIAQLIRLQNQSANSERLNQSQGENVERDYDIRFSAIAYTAISSCDQFRFRSPLSTNGLAIQSRQ
jgi:hypothetical protein